ncbi:MAG: alpha/beta hydrolase, partial [Burkholderiaceae bacterium]|nr:alpha/beta hydrolase [Burkholderiaceae bacterium]
GLPRGVVKQSVRVGAQRGAGGVVRVAAIPGQDVVVLHIAGGPALTLHPETARDLMLAQQGMVKRSRGRGGEDDPSPNEVQVPAQLQWRGLEQAAATRGATRGFLGDVLLSAIEVITGVAKNPAANFIASKAVQHVDDQVVAGLYALAPETLPPLKGATPLARAPAAVDGGPLLVFVHGTFSTTSGSFAPLWSLHPQHVRTLFTKYAGRVYGLDHPTLGVSPISNALTLAQAMPDGARLHLVTHSRGGLVAEVLARVCANPQLSTDDLRFFKGDEYVEQRDALKALASVVRKRGIRVERIVRVACPARGTLLASKRLDAYLSVFKWTLELAGIPVAPVLVDFLGEVAQRRADPQLIPGLAAQIPDSPLVQWLHAVDEPIAGELRVVAGDIEGDSVTSWLKTLLADSFYWTDNDLVVQTRSMYGGAPRAAGASFMLDQGGKVSHFNYFSNERTAEAIINALTQAAPTGFRVIGPLSWSGESATGVRGRADNARGTDAPAVFVLPGILGSNLKIGGKRVWLGWRLINGLKRLDYVPGKADGVEPDGPVGSSYADIAEYLARTHEVIEFAFDWRKPIEEEARRLAVAVEAALDARTASGQP